MRLNREEAEKQSRELIYRAKVLGDDQARQDFFALNYNFLPLVVGRFRGKRIPEEKLEELFHTSMMYAYKGWTHESDQPFIAFMNMAMRSRVSNYWKREVFHAGNDFLEGSISLDAPLMEDSKEDSIAYFIADERDDYERLADNEALIAVIEEFRKTATEEEIFILAGMMGLKSQRVSGDEIGLSQMTVSRRRKRVAEKLRKLGMKHELITGERSKLYVSRREISTAKLHYLFAKKNLTNGEIANVMGCNAVTVSKNRVKYNAGKLHNIDDSAEEMYQRWYSNLPENLKRGVDRRQAKLAEKPSPVKTYPAGFLQPLTHPLTEVGASCPWSPPAPADQEVAVASEILEYTRTDAELTLQSYQEIEKRDMERREQEEKERQWKEIQERAVKMKGMSISFNEADVNKIMQYATMLLSEMKPGKRYDITLVLEESGNAE